jgi:eukaryotic-like serine/threonine-protein kinase
MTSLASVGDGRYALGERIATGGMGEVWRATDTVLGREVAVKILRSEYADDATFRARFQAEARNTAALHHPGVAQVFDFGEIPDTGEQRATAFLVMELVPGEPLSAVLAREGALAPERAADIVAQAAAGIDVAHQRGIVHRDVKPANLLVTPDGTVKVTDFGIARAGDAVPLTGTGQVIGTAQYLSPEQAQGNPATPASDVYSLAVVLYECLTGARPFTAESPVAVAMQHLRDEPPSLPASVPAGLAALCTSALSKEPGGRPATAGDLAARLHEPGLATAAGYAAAATATGPPAADPSPPEHTAVLTGTYPARQRPRRRLGLLVPIAVAVAVLLLVGTLGFALTGNDDPQTGSDAPSGSGGGDAQPQRVRVDPADYVGQPYPAARSALEADGLRVARSKQRGEDGAPGTVAYVQPHGSVPQQATVTLGVWRSPPPAPAPTAESDPRGDHAGNDSAGKGGDKGKPSKGHKDKHGKGHEAPGLLGDLGNDETDSDDGED